MFCVKYVSPKDAPYSTLVPEMFRKVGYALFGYSSCAVGTWISGSFLFPSTLIVIRLLPHWEKENTSVFHFIINTVVFWGLVTTDCVQRTIACAYKFRHKEVRHSPQCHSGMTGTSLRSCQSALTHEQSFFAKPVSLCNCRRKVPAASVCNCHWKEHTHTHTHTHSHSTHTHTHTHTHTTGQC